jgi:hypothetical protein
LDLKHKQICLSFGSTGHSCFGGEVEGGGREREGAEEVGDREVGHDGEVPRREGQVVEAEDHGSGGGRHGGARVRVSTGFGSG